MVCVIKVRSNNSFFVAAVCQVVNVLEISCVKSYSCRTASVQPVSWPFL